MKKIRIGRMIKYYSESCLRRRYRSMLLLLLLLLRAFFNSELSIGPVEMINKVAIENEQIYHTIFDPSWTPTIEWQLAAIRHRGSGEAELTPLSVTETG